MKVQDIFILRAEFCLLALEVMVLSDILGSGGTTGGAVTPRAFEVRARNGASALRLVSRV